MSLSNPTINDKVILQNNNEGTVRFIGTLDNFVSLNNFKYPDPEIYYGIELMGEYGTNNGTIDNVKYFSCNNNKGIFVTKTEIKTIDIANMNALRISVNDQVRIKKFKCIGTVQFIGYTDFKPNIIWYGIKLKCRKGKNDGKVGERRYFKCYPKYGTFVRSESIISLSDYHKLQTKTAKSTVNNVLHLLHGYIRENKIFHHQKSRLNQLYSILPVIEAFAMTLRNNKFFTLLVSDKPYNKKGYDRNKKSKTPLKKIINLDKKNKFNTDKCPQCRNKNGLVFEANYTATKWVLQRQGFVDNVNEYKCSKCGCYVDHIIGYERKIDRYQLSMNFSMTVTTITPFKMKGFADVDIYSQIVKVHRIEIERNVKMLQTDTKYNDLRKKCGECNKKMKLTFYLSRSYGFNLYELKYTLWCGRCKLYLYYKRSGNHSGNHKRRCKLTM